MQMVSVVKRYGVWCARGSWCKRFGVYRAVIVNETFCERSGITV